MSYKDIKFSKNSKFLVTGGAGFIGSNLCEAILEMGYNVKCLDNLSTGHIHNMDSFINHENFEFVQADITNLDACIAATKNIDYVLHQAAWGSVPRSIEMPLFYEKVNILGTLNMLEASRLNKVKKFVYASSSSVYGDDDNLPKVEGIEGNVLSPYALSKKVNEEYAKLYADLYELDTYGLRYFNVFGKRQDPNGAYAAVIPKFTLQLLNDEIPVINGDGNHSRDFTYIDNVIQANLKACLAKSEDAGQAFNVASGGRVSLNELYGQIAKYLNKQSIKPIYGPERAGDIKHSNASIEKAFKICDYVPQFTFQQGLTITLDWYTGK